MDRKHIIGYAFSLGSALCWSSTSVMTKWGVSTLATPLVGATIALFTGGVALMVANRFVTPHTASRQRKKGIFFFALCGLAGGVAVMSNYYALSVLPATVASPIVYSSPLIVLVMVYFWLRRLEKLTPRVIVGCLLVVGGGVLIALGRAH